MKTKQNIIPAGLESDEEFDEYGDCIEKTKFNIIPIKEDFQLTLKNACLRNNVPEIIRALKSGSVDINSHLFDGWTCLMYAAFHGSLDAVTYLLQNGADPLIEYDAHNIVMCVCNCSTYVSNEIDLLKCLKLVSNFDKIDINCKDRYGMTALMYACTNGYLKIIEYLVDNGADIEIKDNQNDETVLFFAVRNNHVDIVKYLLSLGANSSVTDKKKQTVHRIAENKNMTDILKLLNVDLNTQLDVYYSTEHTYWDEVMAEMENGFSKDIKLFLENLSIDHYAMTFKSNNVTFKHLLSGTTDKFIDMGIELLPHRKLLVSALKTFHMWTWSNRSLDIKKYEMNADSIAQYLAIIVRQLHILDASIIYLGKQSHSLDPEKGQRALHYLMIIKATENEIFKILDKQVRIGQVDYIGPHKLKVQSTKSNIKDNLFFTTVVLLTLLCII